MENLSPHKLANVSAQRFNYYLNNSKPLYLSDIFEVLPGLSSWTVPNLINKIGDKEVLISVANNGMFNLDPSKGGFFQPPQKMLFSEFIKYITEEKRESHKPKFYMQQTSVSQQLPELERDLNFPDLISLNKVRAVNLWVGAEGNTSPLHYDSYNNFFIQLQGTKRVLLYPPSDFKNLYPNAWFSKAPHQSKVDPLNVDLENYVRVKYTHPIEIIINAGEMLFIPAYWWHYVSGLNLNVSLNIWWISLLRQRFNAGSFHNFLFTLKRYLHEAIDTVTTAIK